MSIYTKVLILKLIVLMFTNWFMCFGFSFKTKGIEIYINGLFKSYTLDEETK